MPLRGVGGGNANLIHIKFGVVSRAIGLPRDEESMWGEILRRKREIGKW